MTQTITSTQPIDQSPSTRATLTALAAFVGWGLFFVVPALLIAAINDAIVSGPGDDSDTIVPIAIGLAAVSFACAIVGAVWGGRYARIACLALLCLQILPFVVRGNLLF